MDIKDERKVLNNRRLLLLDFATYGGKWNILMNGRVSCHRTDTIAPNNALKAFLNTMQKPKDDVPIDTMKKPKEDVPIDSYSFSKDDLHLIDSHSYPILKECIHNLLGDNRNGNSNNKVNDVFSPSDQEIYQKKYGEPTKAEILQETLPLLKPLDQLKLLQEMFLEIHNNNANLYTHSSKYFNEGYTETQKKHISILKGIYKEVVQKNMKDPEVQKILNQDLNNPNDKTKLVNANTGKFSGPTSTNKDLKKQFDELKRQSTELQEPTSVRNNSLGKR